MRMFVSRQVLGLMALVAWVAAGAFTLSASAQDEPSTGPVTPTPTPTRAAQVPAATPTVEVPGAVARVLERYAQAIAAEDLAAFESCLWQPGDYVPRLQEVLRHFFSVRLKYLQMEAHPGATPEQLILKVKMQTRFRENRTRKPGQYDQQVEFHLERRRQEWRIRSIPDPRSQT